MVKVKEDLTGRVFGKWTVLKQAEDYIQPSNGKHYAMWLCKCSCSYGTVTAVQGNHLINGESTKCKYCFQDENRKRLIEQNKNNSLDIFREPISDEEQKLQDRRKRIYDIWKGMNNRCNNPNNEKYSRYGERGILICDEWKNFDTFYNWAINNGYQDNLSIDRINNNGNYEPNNCRWADNIIQQNNKSTNCLLTYKDETHTLQEWSRITGIDRRTISNRINRNGWSIADALEKPIKQQKREEDLLIEFQQEKHSLSEWSRILNISRETLKSRFKLGWNIEKAFTTPVRELSKGDI